MFNVLAYVAFSTQTVNRPERAAKAKAASASELGDKQQAFVDFVLSQYVKQGVDKLDQEKLSPYCAFAELGQPEQVRALFVGFQRHLYERAQGPS